MAYFMKNNFQDQLTIYSYFKVYSKNEVYMLTKHACWSSWERPNRNKVHRDIG